MPTHLSAGLSLDRIVRKGNHNEAKRNTNRPKSSLIDRRYSWVGVPERSSQWSIKNAGKRPSTADCTGRKSNISSGDNCSKARTDIALYPLFKSQSTQTFQPNTTCKSTQSKPKDSMSKCNMVDLLHPATSISLRPKSSYASTVYRSQYKSDLCESSSRILNPFSSYRSLSARQTSTSLSSARWRIQPRNTISQSKSKYMLLHSFPDRYQSLCERYMQIPLPGVKSHLSKGILDLMVDRVKAEDWGPLLEALYTDRELNKICVRSRYPVQKALESRDKRQRIMPATRCPVIFSQYFLMGLTTALANCLVNSNSLTSLELEGIPLSPKYLSIITDALVKSKHLKHLSLAKCFIGDDGLESICRTLRKLPKVLTLNVSMCGITTAGIGHLVSLLKFQKMNQYIETWQQSLRYQIPNLDTMSGLRRITLNHNPSIGDEGIAQLCEILDDDLWVRAIDLQRTGVGERGANLLISFLRSNQILSIVDVRDNKYVPLPLLKKIMHILAINNKSRPMEYQWINTSSTASLEKAGKAYILHKKEKEPEKVWR